MNIGKKMFLFIFPAIFFIAGCENVISKELNPNVIANYLDGKTKNGNYYVYFKPHKNKGRYDLVISESKITLDQTEKLSTIQQERISYVRIYYSKSEYSDLNYKISERTGMPFIFSTKKGLRKSIPIVVRFYNKKGEAKLLYICEDLKKLKLFFPDLE